ncbi:hypothetical protein VNO78_22301 [Psophocarpus tetragonolobus]|uniref:Uncharacterized protein n=1 Tax=Psophocarpus tetragonolobus TaxID=3891 RepID=A0AAN9SD69_PSOTE
MYCWKSVAAPLYGGNAQSVEQSLSWNDFGTVKDKYARNQSGYEMNKVLNLLIIPLVVSGKHADNIYPVYWKIME